MHQNPKIPPKVPPPMIDDRLFLEVDNSRDLTDASAKKGALLRHLRVHPGCG